MKKLSFYLLAMTMVSGLFFACTEDDPEPKPLARFTATANEDNPFEFTFTNDSENASTYAWDFGDGNTSTEESPVHTYATKGDFTVTLTATGKGGEATSEKTVTVTGATYFMMLTGGAPGSGSSKVWRLMYTDPVNMYNKDDVGQWWFGWGSNLKPGQRNSYRDDEYKFFSDGTFTYDTKGDAFRPDQFYGTAPDGGWDDTESWTTIANGAYSVGGIDGSSWGSGSHNFRFDKTTKVWTGYCKIGTIVLKGKGAHIGPMDAGRQEVLQAPYDSTWYEVYRLADGGDQPDTLEIWTGWGGNELGNGGTRPAIGKIVLVSVKSADQYPDPEDENPAGKPLEVHDIYDTFDADGSMTWAMQDEGAGDVLDQNFDNPSATGLNTTAKVAKWYRSGGFPYSNAQFILNYRMDLSTRNVFKMLVYYPSAGNTGVKKAAVKLQNSLLGGMAWSTQTEKAVTFTEVDSWIELTFDFSDISTNVDYDQIVVQFGGEGDGTPGGTFYFDNFRLL